MQKPNSLYTILVRSQAFFIQMVSLLLMSIKYNGVRSILLNILFKIWNLKFLKSFNIHHWLGDSYDIIFLTETHGEKVKYWKLISLNASITVITKSSEYLDIDCSDEDMIKILCIDNHVTFSCYIPPLESPYIWPYIYHHLVISYVWWSEGNK